MNLIVFSGPDCAVRARGGPCPPPRLALFAREGFCMAHMNLEDFLT